MDSPKFTVYFIHSQKTSFNERVYLPVLRSEALSNLNLIFPTSEKNVNKYYKDLMDTATVIVCDMTEPDQGLTLELKYAVTTEKPILALADATIGCEERLAKLVKTVIAYKNEAEFRYYVEQFVKNYEGKVNDRNEVDKSVVLGVLN